MQLGGKGCGTKKPNKLKYIYIYFSRHTEQVLATFPLCKDTEFYSLFSSQVGGQLFSVGIVLLCSSLKEVCISFSSLTSSSHYETFFLNPCSQHPITRLWSNSKWRVTFLADFPAICFMMTSILTKYLILTSEFCKVLCSESKTWCHLKLKTQVRFLVQIQLNVNQFML